MNKAITQMKWKKILEKVNMMKIKKLVKKGKSNK